jgi:hypothetical protein
VRQANFQAVSCGPTEQAPQARIIGAGSGIEGNQVRNDADGLNATSRFRVLGNFGNPMRVFSSETHATCAGVNNVEGYDDDQFQTS